MSTFTKNLFYSFYSLILLFIISCGGSTDISEQYPIAKKYWDVADYETVIHKLKYSLGKEEKKPCYSDPVKSVVFTKMVDKENFSVVFEDKTLGLSHRSEFGSQMFEKYQAMEELYSDIDNEDKYIYPEEVIDIAKLGLYIQFHYFKLGNEKIEENSDNPNDADVQNILNMNIQTLVDNYSHYLNYVKKDDDLTKEAIQKYIQGMKEYFPILIETYPNADYNGMKNKISDMLNKSKSADIKEALNEVVEEIDSIKAAQLQPTLSDSVSVK